MTTEFSTWAFLRLWVRANVGLAITLAGLIVSSLAFVAVVVVVIARGDFGHLWVNAVAVVYTLTWLFIATITVRTVGPRDLVRAFLAGFFFTMAFSYTLAMPFKRLFGNNDFTVAFVVPVLEEFGKVLAIVLILWSLHRRSGRSVGLSDMTLVGFAVGCGYFVHEDVLYPRSLTSFLDGSVGAAFGHPWGLLFPTHYNVFGQITVAHPGWGLMIGFGVGLAVMLRTQRVIGLAIAAVCFVTAVWSHGSWNARGLPSFIVDITHLLHPVLVVLMVIAAIIVDALRRRQRPPALPRPYPRFYLRARHLAENRWRLVERLVALTRYRREWNAAAYARARDARVPDLAEDPGMISWFLLGVGRPVSRSAD